MRFLPARRRFLVLLAALSAASCSRRATHEALPAGARVLAIGDSLTYGTGATPATSYPAFLAQITGWDVVNAGVPGETAAQVCARLPGSLRAHRPALALVLAGGNDFLRRLPEAGVRDALRECATYARDAGVPIVLLAVPRLGFAGLGNAALYADVAEALKVPVIDPGLADLLAKPSLRADPIHLNADGYRAMARKVAEALADAGMIGR